MRNSVLVRQEEDSKRDAIYGKYGKTRRVSALLQQRCPISGFLPFKFSPVQVCNLIFLRSSRVLTSPRLGDSRSRLRSEGSCQDIPQYATPACAGLEMRRCLFCAGVSLQLPGIIMSNIHTNPSTRLCTHRNFRLNRVCGQHGSRVLSQLGVKQHKSLLCSEQWWL